MSKSSPYYPPQESKILSGRVAADGTKISGAGFQSSRVSLGIYLVTFDTPLANSLYSVVAQPIRSAGSDDYNARAYNISNTGFNIRTDEQDNGNPAGILRDTEFSIIIIK